MLRTQKRIARILIVLIVAAIFVLPLSACSLRQYPRPTREFYINDYANVLLPGTKTVILLEGERLYKDTKSFKNNGAQIVVATMLVGSESEAAVFDRVGLFREWRIGDMGLLVLFLFLEEEGEKYPISAEIEIGNRMEEYITTNEASNLIEVCLLNPEWEGALDMGLGELFYELLTRIYVRAYEYPSFDYDMEDYKAYIDTAALDTKSVPMSPIAFLFSPYSSAWAKVFVFTPIIMLAGGGIAILIIRKRNDGVNGGYGTRRR